MSEVRPTQITEADFRGLMAVFDAPDWHVNEALEKFRERGLIAPEPVDALLIEAREICSAAYRAASYTAYAEEMAQGGQDHFPAMQSTLAALKRGMELAQPALTREMVREAVIKADPLEVYKGDFERDSAFLAQAEGFIDRLHAALTGRQP